MSLEARESLVYGKHLFFQDSTQADDLLDQTLTHTELIAALIYLTETCGHHIEITAVRTDHSDDSDLSSTPSNPIGTHAGGWAVDCWPLSSAQAGDYEDAGTLAFQGFLGHVASAPYLRQIGLGGSAYTAANMGAAGPTAFEDDGADHVHIGTQP